MTTPPTTSQRDQHVPMLVGILGATVAATQVVLGLGHVLALLRSRSAASSPSTGTPTTLAADAYLNAGAWTSLNVAFAAACVAAIVVTGRAQRRGSRAVPWLALALVVGVAAATYTGSTW